MPQSFLVWVGFFLVLLLVVGAAVVILYGLPGGGGSIEEGLPEQIGGWRSSDSVARWDSETIYDYIDGHAEVYLAYGMKRSLARRYTGPEGEGDIVLDLFELASPADAFGVFTHDTDGVPVGVGNDSRLRYGWLSFWRGPWFVSVSSEMESDRASQAVLELGRAVTQLLPAGGDPPAVIAALPAEGLEAASVRFLRHPNILNTHFWVGDENIFGLGPGTAAALGTYDFEGTRGHLLIVDYESEQNVEAALRQFSAHFLAGKEDGVGSFEDRGWFGVRGAGNRVVAVLGAESTELAEWLLSEATEGAS